MNNNSCVVNSRKNACCCVIQGCPIYGEIRFLRIFITCFSLRKKKDLWTNLRNFSYSVRLRPPPPRPHCTFETRGILRTQKWFMDESTGFCLTRFGYDTPPPTDPIALSRLAVFRARRVNFFPATRTYSPRSSRLPKSHDFSEFRLGNPGNHVLNVDNNLHVFINS